MDWIRNTCKLQKIFYNIYLFSEALRRLAPDHVWSSFNMKGQNRESKNPGVETTLVTVYKILLSHVHRTHTGEKERLTWLFKSAMSNFLKNSLRKKLGSEHEEEEERDDNDGALEPPDEQMADEYGPIDWSAAADRPDTD